MLVFGNLQYEMINFAQLVLGAKIWRAHVVTLDRWTTPTFVQPSLSIEDAYLGSVCAAWKRLVCLKWSKRRAAFFMAASKMQLSTPLMDLAAVCLGIVMMQHISDPMTSDKLLVRSDLFTTWMRRSNESKSQRLENLRGDCMMNRHYHCRFSAAGRGVKYPSSILALIRPTCLQRRGWSRHGVTNGGTRKVRFLENLYT